MGDFFISPADLKTLLESGSPPLILDVRKRAAFDESGHMLPGATWCDPFRIVEWSSNQAKDRPLVVLCVHGHEVSQDAGTTLRDAGFEVQVLTGGFEAWREAGFQLVPTSENEGGQ